MKGTTFSSLFFAILSNKKKVNWQCVQGEGMKGEEEGEDNLYALLNLPKNVADSDKVFKSHYLLGYRRRNPTII